MTEPTTWATSGLDLVSQQIMRNVAEQFPDGPTAYAVRLLDSREPTTVTTTAK